MERLSGSRFNFLWICFSVISLGLATAQMPDPFPFGDVLGTNSQLLKSFQEEMKTLENAAHRVNALLSKPPLPNAAEDQDTKAAESPLDVTVLASPDKLRNGIPTNTGEAKPKDDNKKLETPQDGVRQPFNPHVNLGSFLNSFGFLKSLPEPWWKGKNVCVKRSEKTENKNNGEKEVDKHVIVMGTGTFEHCKQTSGKYICTTVTSTPQTTKTVSMTYQCCEGFRRQADGCVRGEHSSQLENAQHESEPLSEFVKDAVPQARYDVGDLGKTAEDSSFSSQSEEENGQPRWLHNFYQRNRWMKK